ncbi:hypothetical protein C8R45DRAFT_1041944 [Mycena sanguinolenta]|nr:hypothetical protein C8R45DRAFT_1041944 [Mycena sanguinolenta]
MSPVLRPLVPFPLTTIIPYTIAMIMMMTLNVSIPPHLSVFLFFRDDPCYGPCFQEATRHRCYSMPTIFIT